MKRLAIGGSVLLAGIAAVLALFTPPAAYAAPPDGQIRVLVELKPGQQPAIQQTLGIAGAKVHYTFEKLNTVAMSVPASALDGLRRNPNVARVELDPPRYLIGGPSARGQSASGVAADSIAQTVPFGIDMVQARDVWDANRDGVVDTGAPTGTHRMICIIDSGFYIGHEDLPASHVVGGYPTGWNTDACGHGSHVAGTISAINNSVGVVGVAPEVSLYLVKVFGDDCGWTYASTLIDAANRCASAGANVISMSLGGAQGSRTEQRAFDSLYSKGILSIAAAGNDGTTGYSYPASYSSVMSVAAIDSTGAVADFSQKNSQVEIAAPGVGVLSTIPWVATDTLTVSGVTYTGNHVEFAAYGTPSGQLVDGGLCDATNGVWAGKIVLCQRGTVSFLDKVMNVQTSGGAAAVLYNNVPGGFLGTLGAGNSSAIPAISLTQEDGQFLVANRLGLLGGIVSTISKPDSGYEAWDGTSMATPHVSAVAALAWSSKPAATNVAIRNALDSTALDLGPAGRDTSYGYGLVQAHNAWMSLGGNSPPQPMHVGDLDRSAVWVSSSYWKATVTIAVKDTGGAPVSGATVTGTWSGGASGSSSCTTQSSGSCQVSTGNIGKKKTSATFSVTKVTHATLVYDASANTDPDGDSNGTTITVPRP